MLQVLQQAVMTNRVSFHFSVDYQIGFKNKNNSFACEIIDSMNYRDLQVSS